MDPWHAFGGRRAGTHCSCGHGKGEHVTRHEPGKDLRALCRACQD